MAIRKTGAATGEVTGIEQEGITREASRQDWGPDDDKALADENMAADEGPRGD